jgi:uncharacterized protein (DUF2252 family)
MDPNGLIRRFNAGRDPERLALKYRTMRDSPLGFLRGAAHLFYARLAAGPGLVATPLAWICGDLHVENFGSYRGDNRLAYVDINDFDEAALAPAGWDLLRFLTSLSVAGDRLASDPQDLKTLAVEYLGAYADAMALGKPFWIEREAAQGPLRDLLDGLRDRKRVDFLNERTVLDGKRRRLRTDGKKALPASRAQRDAACAVVDRFAADQPDPDRFRVLDVARRVAGVASLGIERFVILVEGKGSPDGNLLLDLKQALPSSLVAAMTPALAACQPAWDSDAQRIVGLQRRLQAVEMAFLHPVRFGDHAAVLRGLQPAEDRVRLDRSRLKAAQVRQGIADMGRLTAWSQLRGAARQGAAGFDAVMAFGADPTWHQPLRDAAALMAAQVRRDAASFAKAFDSGEFEPLGD